MNEVAYILLKNGEPVQGFKSYPEAETEVRRKVGKNVKIRWVQEEQGVWFWRSPSHDMWEIEVAFV